MKLQLVGLSGNVLTLVAGTLGSWCDERGYGGTRPGLGSTRAGEL
jgi:hypothetical protein